MIFAAWASCTGIGYLGSQIPLDTICQKSSSCKQCSSSGDWQLFGVMITAREAGQRVRIFINPGAKAPSGEPH